MEAQQDFKELLASFNANAVEYVSPEAPQPSYPSIEDNTVACDYLRGSSVFADLSTIRYAASPQEAVTTRSRYCTYFGQSISIPPVWLLYRMFPVLRESTNTGFGLVLGSVRPMQSKGGKLNGSISCSPTTMGYGNPRSFSKVHVAWLVLVSNACSR